MYKVLDSACKHIVVAGTSKVWMHVDNFQCEQWVCKEHMVEVQWSACDYQCDIVTTDGVDQEPLISCKTETLNDALFIATLILIQGPVN
jgi:hypothetical protein